MRFCNCFFFKINIFILSLGETSPCHIHPANRKFSGMQVHSTQYCTQYTVNLNFIIIK